MEIIIRPIKQLDNHLLANLIREVFREFKIARPGTVYTDPTTDNLYDLFQAPQSAYWVAVSGSEILGGCGIYPTPGLPEGCAELVKFYLSPGARGKGIGKKLMDKSVTTAREMGYQQLYLESFPELSKAIGMYKKAGFRHIDRALGNSGHFSCNIWMVKDFSH